VLSDKAGWQAPANLQLRVAAVPDEVMAPGRLWQLVTGVPRVARLVVVALVVVLAAGSIWIRYEVAPPGSASASPGSVGSPLTIETEAPLPLPSGLGWSCAAPQSSLSLRV
jgi:hypothetical protein